MLHLYQSHSANCCRCVKFAISEQTGNKASQHPTYNSWTHCLLDWSWAFSEKYTLRNTWVSQGVTSKVLCCFCETNSTTLRPRGHQLKMTTPVEDHVLLHTSRENRLLLIGVQNKGGADQANWTLGLCPHGPKTFGSSWMSLKTSSHRYPKLTPDYRHATLAVCGHAVTRTWTVITCHM